MPPRRRSFSASLSRSTARREKVNAMQRREYPIKDYAPIANCETAGLINPEGGIDWLGPAAFEALSFSGALHRSRKGRRIFQPIRGRPSRRAPPASATLPSSRRAFVREYGVVRRTDFFVIARERSERFYDFTSLRPFNPWAYPH